MAQALATPAGAVYGRALFDAVDAADSGALSDVGARLEGLGAAWDADRNLRAYFLSGYVSEAEKVAAMDKLVATMPKLLANFLRLLLERGRLRLLPEIAASFNKMLDERLGRVPVTLTTAVPVDDAALDGWIAKIRQTVGGEPVVKHVIKPEILAGAIIRVGDQIADGSAKRKIAELRQQIIQRGKQTHALQS